MMPGTWVTVRNIMLLRDQMKLERPNGVTIKIRNYVNLFAENEIEQAARMMVLGAVLKSIK